MKVDLEGDLLRIRTAATAPREAVDRLVDRLTERLRRSALHWESRRGRTFPSAPHEWRHGYPPGPRPARAE